MAAAPDPDTVRREFAGAVNMTAGELERWPATDESRAVGPSGRRGRTRIRPGGGIP